MKFLILILLFSFPAMATYMPESKIGQSTDGMELPSKKSDCKNLYGEDCFDARKNKPYAKVIETQDFEMYNELCTPLIDCDEKLIALVCDEGFVKKEGLISVYCYKQVYAHVVDDVDLKAAYDLVQASQAVQVNAFKSQMNDMAFGKELYAKVMLMNKAKGLSRTNRKQIRNNLTDIRDDLFDGDICAARSGVNEIVPDGTLIKTEDITAVISLIDAYKVCQ